jgi:hypothetical protein
MRGLSEDGEMSFLDGDEGEVAVVDFKFDGVVVVGRVLSFLHVKYVEETVLGHLGHPDAFDRVVVPGFFVALLEFGEGQSKSVSQFRTDLLLGVVDSLFLHFTSNPKYYTTPRNLHFRAYPA